jgi:hypothetical protein
MSRPEEAWERSDDAEWERKKAMTTRPEEARDALPCPECGGETVVDSGGVMPWGEPAMKPCPACTPTTAASGPVSRELLQEAREWILTKCSDECDAPPELLRRIDARLAAPASAEQSRELDYATTLARSLWEKHYQQRAPDWKPLPDLFGVLTQIDNMTCRLVRAAPSPAPAEPVAFVITDEKINHLQVNTIRKTVERCKHAHHTDLQLRINGQDEWLQADWVKHMQIAAAPTPAVGAEQPKFPTMLRKMWSGTEVQNWINEHWTAPTPEVEQWVPNEVKEDMLMAGQDVLFELFPDKTIVWREELAEDIYEAMEKARLAGEGK